MHQTEKARSAGGQDKKEAATKADTINPFKKIKESGADPSVKAESQRLEDNIEIPPSNICSQ